MTDVTTREQAQGAVVARYRDEGDGTHSKAIATNGRVWDTINLVWVRQAGDSTGATTTTGGASGGGGAATIADGADVAQGTTTDLSSANTVVGILKAIKAAITGTVAVSGTFWQATQPVSGTVTANAGTGPFPVSDNGGSITVDGTVAVSNSFALDATLTGGTQKSKLVDTGGTNVASVSAAGALKVDASSVAVPITDNAGSVTVDAPVATPVFVRLSDGAAAITALPVTDNAGSITVDSTQLPAALAAGGGIKVEGVSGGVAQPINWASAYPTAAVPITNSSAKVANASAVATLAAAVGKTTYITGFQCTASGATAGLSVSVTVVGVITGTLTYAFTFPAGVVVAAQPLIVAFPIPVPASATNTAIVVTLAASGAGGTNATSVAQGFQL